MQKQLGAEYADEKFRISFLKDNCDEVIEKGYMKPYSEEQIETMKDDLSEVSIKIDDIETEKKIIMEQFKGKLKPLETEKTELLTGIRTKSRFVRELCFKFIDTDLKMVGFYNAEGNLIESRPCNADELQQTIFQINRSTGTEK